MSGRPRWVKEVTRFLGDTIIDEKYEYPMNGEDDDLLDEIEAAVNAVLCGHYGHEIENDQCGIPEHRYCVWCHLRETTINAQQQASDPGTDGPLDGPPHSG